MKLNKQENIPFSSDGVNVKIKPGFRVVYGTFHRTKNLEGTFEIMSRYCLNFAARLVS